MVWNKRKENVKITLTEEIDMTLCVWACHEAETKTSKNYKYGSSCDNDSALCYFRFSLFSF